MFLSAQYLSLGYQVVCKLVPIVGSARKMLRQDRAATLDSSAVSAARIACSEAVGDDPNHLVPAPRLDLFIDSTIGEDHDTSFQKGGENQNSRMTFGVMETVTCKGGETVEMNRFGNSILGEEESLDTGNAANN